jgi:hypothetical protein
VTPTWVAVLGFASTVVINVSAVTIAWLSIKTRTNRIETAANGNLEHERARADAAHSALATIATAVASETPVNGTPT